MDAVLAKLQKLYNIENRLGNMFEAVSTAEDTLAGLNKEVCNLKENDANKTVKELEDTIAFNDGEIADLGYRNG